MPGRVVGDDVVEPVAELGADSEGTFCGDGSALPYISAVEDRSVAGGDHVASFLGWAE